MSDEQEPTPIPERVDLARIRDDIARRREAGYEYLIIKITEVESLIIEALLYRNHEDSRRRRTRDAARARQSARTPPPHITVDNVDQYDET